MTTVTLKNGFSYDIKLDYEEFKKAVESRSALQRPFVEFDEMLCKVITINMNEIVSFHPMMDDESAQ